MRRRIIDQSYTLVDIDVDYIDDSKIDRIKKLFPMLGVGISVVNKFNTQIGMGNNIKFFITHLYFNNANYVVEEIKKYYENDHIRTRIVT